MAGIFGCAGREVEVVVWWGAMVVGINPVVAGQIPVGGGGRRQVMVGGVLRRQGHGSAAATRKEGGRGKEAGTRGAGSAEEGGGGVGLCSCGRWVVGGFVRSGLGMLVLS